MSNDFIEGLRQKALAEALGDADKATQLFFQSLKQYEKAIQSYKAAQKIYPLLDSAKKMIPVLQELINDQII